MTTATVEEVQETAVAQEVVERAATVYENFWNENPIGVMELTPEEITIRPEDNGRVVTAQAGDKKLKELVASIERSGQLQPVKVRLIDGQPVLAFGFRRYAALTQLGKTVQAMVTFNESDDSDDLDSYSKNASENIQREALNAIDMLRIFERMAAKVEDGGFGLGQKEIGDRCGVSRSLVNVYLNNLGPLSDASKKLILDGKVSASAAIELMASKTLTPEQVDAELVKLAAGTVEGGTKGKSVREVRKATRKKAEAEGKGVKKQRTSKEIVADLEEEVAGDHKSVKAIKAALLKYVKGGMSFDTLVKKITEVV